MNYISCDQVIWIQNALSRYADLHHNAIANNPRIADGYIRTHKLGCIIELMDILGLQVEDNAALNNILSGVKAAIPQDKINTITEE